MDTVVGNLAGSVAATFIPVYAGILVAVLIARRSASRVKILMAVSSGIIFWFFLDVMNDAVLLDINQGFAGGFEHAMVAGLFALGLLLLLGLEGAYFRTQPQNAKGNVLEGSYAIALLVALGIGFHAIAEGIEIGSLIPTAPNMIEAIGGFGPGVAYFLHKLLEGFVVGVFASMVRDKNPSRFLSLGLVSGIPTLVGSLLALSTPINSAFFFAMGGAAAVYIEYKLIPGCFGRDASPLYVAASLVGFYSMYLAGLFHG